LFFFRGHGDRQCAAHRLYRSVEGQLADQEVLLEQVFFDRFFGGQNANRHRQIVGRSFLFDVGWSEIDGDAFGGEVITAVFHRGADPVFALFNRSFRQSHGGKLRQPRCEIDFYFDAQSIDAVERGAVHLGEHGRARSARTLPKACRNHNWNFVEDGGPVGGAWNMFRDGDGRDHSNASTCFRKRREHCFVKIYLS
jgi:hypothetical protein